MLYFEAIDPLHTVLDIITPLAIGGGSWVIWMVKAKNSDQHAKNVESLGKIKTVILEDKIELLRDNARVKEELIAHNTKLAEEVRVHSQKDESVQAEILRRLDLMDKKLDTKT